MIKKHVLAETFENMGGITVVTSGPQDTSACRLTSPDPKVASVPAPLTESSLYRVSGVFTQKLTECFLLMQV